MFKIEILCVLYFLRDSTYSIHTESLNCILVVLSIQMYTIQSSSSLITYRYTDLKLALIILYTIDRAKLVSDHIILYVNERRCITFNDTNNKSILLMKKGGKYADHKHQGCMIVVTFSISNLIIMAKYVVTLEDSMTLSTVNDLRKLHLLYN